MYCVDFLDNQLPDSCFWYFTRLRRRPHALTVDECEKSIRQSLWRRRITLRPVPTKIAVLQILPEDGRAADLTCAVFLIDFQRIPKYLRYCGIALWYYIEHRN